ncbi:MAG: ATP-binding protein [Paraclostridium sordellii]
MKFSQYIKDKVISIFIILITCTISSLFMYIVKININSIVFVQLLFLMSIILVFILDFFKKKQYYDEFFTDFNSLDEKSHITEIIKKPKFIEGKILYDILKIENKYTNDIISEYKNNFIDYQQYIETWIHEVKTPIATSKLIIENNKNIVTLSIEEEIDKIDGYVEQVLYLAKSDSVEKDYHIKKVYLKNMVMNEVKKHSKEIINENIKPVMGNLDFYVLSDAKWIEFIIGQIINNSIKYKRNNAKIEFYSEKEGNKVSLYIKDNGLGIQSQDISRVFEKGFTGSNGRKGKNSTGIGLYICKKLCEKLDVDINLYSEFERGTTIKLTFTEAV